ncbi:MAG TPA: MFS transporter [Symbiobacteriaceae bacterium]|nr:MFS transporter [Symbiobacteriaceae bacterium]
MSAYKAPANGFRTFVIVWLSQSVSVLGTQLTIFAINIWLATVLYARPEQKPQLAWAMTALSLSHFLPVILFTPMAGAWADRHDRKRTMLVVDIMSGVVSLTMALLMWQGYLSLWSLLAGASIYGILGAFHNSAFDTAYAMLVPDSQLPRANGMMQTMWALAFIFAPGLAAMLVSIPQFAQQGQWGGALGHLLAGLSSGTPLAIAIDGVSFLGAALVLAFLTVPSPKRADLGTDGKPKRSMAADIREGAVYIWRRRPMLWLLGTFTLFNALGQWGLITPLLVKYNLAADWAARGMSYETALATVNTIGSIGGVIAGVGVSMWGGLKRRRVYGVVVPLLITAILQILYGFSPTVIYAAAFSFLIGLVIPAANVHSQAIWQTQVPRELQGRVFAVRRVIAQATGPIGMTMVGWLAGRFDPGMVLVAFGAVLVVFCAGQLINPGLLKVEDKEYLDRMAQAKAEAMGD